jgi:hypothetical protein
VTLFRGSARTTCRGPSRRAFLQAGTLGALALSGTPPLAAARGVPGTFGRAKHCILLFLTGGPPQIDTFDPKPDAPAEYRGDLRATATSVPGVRVSELFPRLARQMHRVCLVRSVTHDDTVHTSAGYTMFTGVRHPLANSGTARNIFPTPDDHPHFGSVLARARPGPGVPTFAALPEVIRDAGINEFPGQGGGFLGKTYDPFRIEAEAGGDGFRPPEIVLPSDISAERLRDRRRLLESLERAARSADDGPGQAGRDAFTAQAFELLRSPRVQQAFLLDREPDRSRDHYGHHLFGQGCLLARRLLEAGVALVTVYWHYEGPDDSPVWDTHENNFKHLRERLAPPADAACAALLDDIAARGLLDETLVIVMGEFGRSPRINAKGGREHWPHVQTALLAGAGVRGGSVYGASDRRGAYPADSPVPPADLLATFLHLLGVDPATPLRDRIGRVVPASAGTPVAGVMG